MAAKKTRPSKKPPPAPPQVSGEMLDKIVLLVVSLQSAAAVKGACLEKLGLTPDQADAALEQARAKIRDAIEADRQEQAGEATIRLNDIYERSLRTQDLKTALAAQKELNRLLGLCNAAAVKKPAWPAAAPKPAQPLTNLKLKIARPA
jgi:hypothetical protein